MKESILDDASICASFVQAWHESQPGSNDAHEEGGFVLRQSDDSLYVERWPTGAKNEIFVPPHPAGQRNDLTVVATFHTHPNTGQDFQQEPSLTDIRAVRDDSDLRHADYEGEYVIAAKAVYRIQQNGKVDLIGDMEALLKIN